MKQYKYLVVDKDYGIYGLAVLSGRVRNLVKQGELSLIRLRDTKGMNITGEFVDFDEYEGMTDLNVEPTHRCKICGALWHYFDEGELESDSLVAGTWSLVSSDCGSCCDNVEMGNQIETIAEWALRAKEQNWLDMLAKLMRENGFHAAPVKSVRHTPHVECLVAIGPDHTASIVMDEDALKELKNRTGVV